MILNNSFINQQQQQQQQYQNINNSQTKLLSIIKEELVQLDQIL